MSTQNEANEKGMHPIPQHPSFDIGPGQKLSTLIFREEGQDREDDSLSRSFTELPCDLSPRKSPPSSTDMTLPGPSSSSLSRPVWGTVCSSLSGPTGGTLGQLYGDDFHFPSRQQPDDDDDDNKHERAQDSDSDCSGTNGKTERNRRFREFVPDVEKDDVYWEKRRKNNEAARRSREKRRISDIVLASKINILEQDNSRLRRELIILKKNFNLSDDHLYADKDTTFMQSDATRVNAMSSSSLVNSHHLSTLGDLMGPHNKPSPHTSQRSPPPLLTFTDNLPVGLTVFSSRVNTGVPYFVSDAAAKFHNTKTPTPSFATRFHQYQDYQVSKPHVRYPSGIQDKAKDTREERDDFFRSRSNVNGLPTLLDQPLVSMFKKNGLTSYPKYYQRLCLPNFNVGGPHLYSNIHTNDTNHMHHFQNAYESRAMLQTSSPAFNRISNTNFDDPLNQTLCNETNFSRNNWITTDPKSKESVPTVLDKPEKLDDCHSLSAPLNLCHKPPSRDAIISTSTSPSTVQPASPVQKQSYQDPSILNRLPNLPNSGLQKDIPLSLITCKLPFPFSQKKLSPFRPKKPFPGSKCLDPLYLEMRRKNNEAARKCRENRKTVKKCKEDRPTCHGMDNSKLKVKMTCLQKEIKQLRNLFKSKHMDDSVQKEYNG